MTDFFSPTVPLGMVDLAIRATILLAAALALQWLTRRGPAATRHHLWTLTFALLLVLPALRMLGPSWNVPLLPNVQIPSGGVRTEALEPVVPAYSGGPAGTLAFLAADAPAAGGAAMVLPAGSFTRAALILWAIGCAASLASLAVGSFRFYRRLRAAEPVEDQAWLEHLRALREQLSIRADVRLVLGTEAVTPMTGGLRRPVILLPPAATDWSEARRHVVLVHELIHVRRRDVLRQLVGRAVLSFYWFHPLGWVASRLAAVRREEACDEEVLAAGTRPSEYAGHLLSLAEGGSLRRSVLSLPMALRSSLERRIRAILGPGRARPQVLVTALAMTAVTVVGISVAVANPFRLESGSGTLSAAAVLPSSVDCAASAADGEFGQLFAGADGLFVCTLDEAAVAKGGAGVRAIGPHEWALLEGEIRRQIGTLSGEGRGRGRKEGLTPPQVDAGHGPSPR
ncbi:MAG: M56 family metallopeptidase [Acidobacteria bacterium]|nr:M56 family metallopeptidase [Acidobacteriota bacterium]